MKLSDLLSCLAVVGLTTASSCNGDPSTPGTPTGICNEPLIAAVQQLYPIPGSQGVASSGLVIYAESVEQSMAVSLVNGTTSVATTATALPSPLPSPIATPAYPDASTTLQAVAYGPLHASTRYSVVAIPGIASSAACPPPHIPLGAFTTH